MNFKSAFLILFIFIYACPKIRAQNWQFGFKGGLSLPNLSSPSGSSEVSQGYHTISGPDFACVADYKLSEKISIESGLEWSTQGGEKSGLQAIPKIPGLEAFFPPGSDFKYLYADFTSSVRLQYLMLPVLVKYSMNLGNSNHWKFYVDGGIFGAYLLKAEGSVAGSSKVYYDKEETKPVTPYIMNVDSSQDISSQLYKGNFGIEGNLGLIYQVHSMAVYGEAGGNYGFIDLQKDSGNGINHTGAIVFRVGIFFYLNKKD